MKKINKYISALMCFIICMVPLDAYAAFRSDYHFRTQYKAFISQYSRFMTVFSSIALLTSIAVFLYHCTMLAVSADNAQKRAEAMKGLLTTGICLSIESSLMLFVSIIFWSLYVY